MPSEELKSLIPICSVFRRFLKSKSLRYTKERADVLDAIMSFEDRVFDIDMILSILSSKEIGASKATVYRTVTLIQEAGIIDRAFVNGRQTHYQLISGKKQSDHMICVATGNKIAFNEELAKQLSINACKEMGWSFVGYKFQIYGISPDVNQEQE